jgi:NitT/TauT family transport system permease protein
MGANRWQRFRYVILPHMLPSFFTAMRLSMVSTLLGVLLAELYASSNGIGFFTRQFTDSFDPTSLFGLVSIIALMAICINEALRRAEIKASAWRRR